MAHPQQKVFCQTVKDRFPIYFAGVLALDIGSLDINGNNQYLFDAESLYLGVDVGCGKNVDVVCAAHELGLPAETFDVIVSTECLEHDKHWSKTLRNAQRMLRPGGLLLITCATTGRPEHGTKRTTPQDAPLLSLADADWGDYYRNLTEADFGDALDVSSIFTMHEFSIGEETHDLYFFAVKKGKFVPRDDRSAQLDTSGAKRLASELRLQLQHVFKALNNSKNDIQFLDEKIALEREINREMKLALNAARNDPQVEILQKELLAVRSSMVQAQSEKAIYQGQLGLIRNSLSWRATVPLRMISARIRRAFSLFRRAKNAARYVVRLDLSGLKKRIHAVHSEAFISANLESGPPKRWAVLATPHTLFVGHMVLKQLLKRGFEAEIFTNAPLGFPHDMYVVICPQMFSELPPGQKRVCYQMEQSVSSRWFTKEYLDTLESSVAVLDYSLRNIEFLASKKIAYPHVFYLPVGADPEYAKGLHQVEKNCEVLFYGDSRSSERRRALLDILAKNFDVKICSEVFGLDMVEAIRGARIVINLHYYENALLEIPRIQECLSLGVPVVSESTGDQSEYPELERSVMFFPAGDVDAMVAAVSEALSKLDDLRETRCSTLASSKRFDFLFDRFLVAMGWVTSATLLNDPLPIDGNISRVGLSMPETIFRRRTFEANRPAHCEVFDGVRLKPSWIGCGLSYLSLARHGLLNGLKRLTIIEDDALLPENFEEKMKVVDEYLDTLGEDWDVFAGVIASLHSEVRILNVQVFKGIRFVTIDRMTSMVCNVYSDRAMRILASWDSQHVDDQTNTIDKYLERQGNLRVVVALPFFVGHREEVHSTLWGFQNTQYSSLIKESEEKLEALVLNLKATASLRETGRLAN